jgi:DNA-binding transcriptional MerR regulator/methylmalonyl-CoA mutase cobalamin-binding subunit
VIARHGNVWDNSERNDVHVKTARQRHRAPGHDAFPLRTVAAMTGLTPDLVRAWEKRHGVVTPIRGARGARLYTSADIAHLRLLARVVGAGRAIGDVAALSTSELEKLAARPGPTGEATESVETLRSREDFVARILERLGYFDHAGVSRLLGDAVVALGVRAFVYEIALPLVHQVGARWAEGQLSIGEEHLLTGVLRNLLGGLMQGRASRSRPVLLATPVGERHEVGLLLVALLALDAGADPAYLGVDLPAAEIVKAVEHTRARVVGLSVVGSGNRAHAVAEVTAIQSALPAEIEIWLGGGDAREVAAGIKVFGGLVLDTLQAAETELARIALGTPPAARVDGWKP